MSSLVEWRETAEGLTPHVEGREVVWAPQPGSQEAFLECPVFEVLYEGTRGPGKTDALLMSFAQHVGRGYGAEWRGILFRQTFPQLSDVVVKTKKWFPRIWPSCTFNESRMTWAWPTGETLRLSYMGHEDDYWNYHGHAYPWIGWEELTTWPDDRCYKVMMACSRSTFPGMPRLYRATTNPYGLGHNWVKARFRLPLPPSATVGPVIRDDGPHRVAIRGRLQENRILLTADPEYVEKIRSAARNPSELKAWLEGSWDIVAGGMVDDVWVPVVHVVPNIPFDAVPRSWRLDRSYDHGQSHPFSVGWWAESSGEPIEVAGRTYGAVRGDLYRLVEWYGWNGAPNEGVRMLATEIADGIVEREVEWWGDTSPVLPGPADTSIFDDIERGKSVAKDMASRGVRWQRADKSPGSRKQGWQQLRKYLRNAVPPEDGYREEPGLFVCERCTQFIRTIPTLPRDSRDLDEVPKEAEDHIADETRYRIRRRGHGAVSRDM